ncbi:hypothetical protein V2G26_004049 [Clonostachys chloroleuca]
MGKKKKKLFSFVLGSMRGNKPGLYLPCYYYCTSHNVNANPGAEDGPKFPAAGTRLISAHDSGTKPWHNAFSPDLVWLRDPAMVY